MTSIIPPRFEKVEAARRQIRREVNARYEEEMKRAGIWQRLLIWWKIERAVIEEMKRRFPPGALYARRSPR